jgi:hypothetical protein
MDFDNNIHDIMWICKRCGDRIKNFKYSKNNLK